MLQIKRFFSPSQSSYFLLGPRGTGKTTLLKNTYKNALYIDLLLAANFVNYSNNPDRLIDFVAANPHKQIVIIDEIQQVPELLSVIHYLIENNKNLQFILTGSSARKLKKENINLLGGRAIPKYMHPFLASELKKHFQLDDALKYGLLPVIFTSTNKKEQLDAYINLYLKEEIQMEGLTRNIGNFTKFLEIISFSHGSILNISNIAREAKIDRKVTASYLQILEDLLLSYRLNVFVKRAKRNLVSMPKFYFFDTGVYNFLRPKGQLDRPEEIAGMALEGLVLQNIYAYLDSQNIDANVFYWKTKSGVEVDFIVYGQDCFIALEVKNAASLRKNQLKGLKAFKQDYPEAKSYLLYRGAEQILIDDILAIPIEKFLVDIEQYL